MPMLVRSTVVFICDKCDAELVVDGLPVDGRMAAREANWHVTNKRVVCPRCPTYAKATRKGSLFTDRQHELLQRIVVNGMSVSGAAKNAGISPGRGYEVLENAAYRYGRRDSNAPLCGIDAPYADFLAAHYEKRRAANEALYRKWAAG